MNKNTKMIPKGDIVTAALTSRSARHWRSHLPRSNQSTNQKGPHGSSEFELMRV